MTHLQIVAPAGYPLAYVRQEANAYEERVMKSDMSGIYCGANETVSLAYNATTWNVFRILESQASYPLTLVLQQQTSRSVILFDAYSAGGSSPGMSAKASVSRNRAFVNRVQDYLVTPDHPPTFEEGKASLRCLDILLHNV